MTASPVFGSYISARSSVHRLHPAVKLVCAVLLASSVMISSHRIVLLYASTFLVSAAVLSDLPFRMTLLVGKKIWFLLVVTIAVNLFFAPGSGAGGFNFSLEGFASGTLLAWRILVLAWLMWILTSTTSPLELSDTFDLLSGKVKWLPLGGAGVVLSIAMRFVPVFFEEAERLKKAQMSRGLDFSGGPLAKAKHFVPILVPLLAGAVRRAENLAVALEARCYHPGTRRPFVTYPFGQLEVIALLGASVAVALSIVSG